MASVVDQTQKEGVGNSGGTYTQMTRRACWNGVGGWSSGSEPSFKLSQALWVLYGSSKVLVNGVNFGPGFSIFGLKLLFVHRERVLADYADLCDVHGMQIPS
jgi:hypothetical protein